MDEAPRPRRLGKAHLWGLLGGLCAFLLDQATKLLVEANLGRGELVRIIGDYLRIRLVYNRHTVWGLSFGENFPYALMVALISLGVLVAFLLERKRSHVIPLGFILGGALGNLTDRLRIGAVVDWIDMGIGHWRWATYNIADSAIFLSVVFMVLMSLRKRGDELPGDDKGPG